VVLNVALPLLSVPEPSVIVPFLKVTLPVGVPPTEVTVAVKVTAAPNVEGFGVVAKEVKVVATGVEAVAMKVAVTALAALMVTGQVAVHFSLQPAKIAFVAGLAVRITVTPVAKFARQVPGQLMPGGLLVTEPVPTPVTLTVSGWIGAGV
jgi:hypothetical protein